MQRYRSNHPSTSSPPQKLSDPGTDAVSGTGAGKSTERAGAGNQGGCGDALLASFHGRGYCCPERGWLRVRGVAASLSAIFQNNYRKQQSVKTLKKTLSFCHTFINRIFRERKYNLELILRVLKVSLWKRLSVSYLKCYHK